MFLRLQEKEEAFIFARVTTNISDNHKEIDFGLVQYVHNPALVLSFMSKEFVSRPAFTNRAVKLGFFEPV